MFAIVMGVSGSGKSTVGIALAAACGWPFVDADDLHSPANKAKMAAHHPLTDEDRAGWLAAVRRQMDAWAAAGTSGVIACSALKRRYRDVLRDGAGPVRFVYLDIPREILAARLLHRHGHFMPPDLLDSQLATLEPPAPDEQAITVSGPEPASQVGAVAAELGAGQA